MTLHQLLTEQYASKEINKKTIVNNCYQALAYVLQCCFDNIVLDPLEP